MEDRKRIKNVSNDTEQIIKRKTAYSLPDRPSESGMRAEDIKKAFYAGLVDRNDSLLSELNRVIEEANRVSDDLYRLIDESKREVVGYRQGQENSNKNLTTDYQGNITPTDYVLIGGDIKIYKEIDTDGNASLVFEFPEEGTNETNI